MEWGLTGKDEEEVGGFRVVWVSGGLERGSVSSS